MYVSGSGNKDENVYVYNVGSKLGIGDRRFSIRNNRYFVVVEYC